MKNQDNPNATTEKTANYAKKMQQELDIYEKQVNVHDLPEIFHYWSNKYLRPIFSEAGFENIEHFFVMNLIEIAKTSKSKKMHFASVGSGNCDFEVHLSKLLIESKVTNFVFHCIDINPTMLERGRSFAVESGLEHHLNFVEADFNTWRPTIKFHAVLANQALHHVTNLEHLYDEISSNLVDGGQFIISDMIGRNGHQRWPEALDLVHRFWEELPDDHRYNVLLNRHEELYENWDCSNEGFEGIRAEEVLPLLLERFKCQKFIGFGNIIDIFIDRCFGHHFDPNNKWETGFIDRVHHEDEERILDGSLTPTHMLGVFSKMLSAEPYYSRGISPESSVRKPSIE